MTHELGETSSATSMGAWWRYSRAESGWIISSSFITEANVYKRLGRARTRLRDVPFAPDDLAAAQLTSRLPAVLSILYLMFTEGYLSSHAEQAIRRELCEEAKRLAEVLAEHPVGARPETFALLALMHLHGARMSARQDRSGGLLLGRGSRRAEAAAADPP